jgi:hypothetical protein
VKLSSRPDHVVSSQRTATSPSLRLSPSGMRRRLRARRRVLFSGLSSRWALGRTFAAPPRSECHGVREVHRDELRGAVLDATRGAPQVAKRLRLISSQQGSRDMQQSCCNLGSW